MSSESFEFESAIHSCAAARLSLLTISVASFSASISAW
jgi:hypothetical protein